MKRIIAIMLALVMVVALCACGNGDSKTDDKVYTLTVANHDSSTSIGEKFVEDLLNQISEESGGRLQFQYNPGGSLFSAGESVEAVRSGNCDICWNSSSAAVGIFPVSEALTVPLLGITCARMGSKVYQDMYNEIPEVAAEFEDFKVITVHSCGTAPISTISKKLETPADLKGMVIRAAGTALGPPDTYPGNSLAGPRCT